MKKLKYMKIEYSIFPQDNVEKYKLDNLVAPDGYIYMERNKERHVWA